VCGLIKHNYYTLWELIPFQSWFMILKIEISFSHFFSFAGKWLTLISSQFKLACQRLWFGLWGTMDLSKYASFVNTLSNSWSDIVCTFWMKYPNQFRWAKYIMHGWWLMFHIIQFAKCNLLFCLWILANAKPYFDNYASSNLVLYLHHIEKLQCNFANYFADSELLFSYLCYGVRHRILFKLFSKQ